LQPIELLASAALIDSSGINWIVLDTSIKGVILVSTFIVHTTNGGHGFRLDESLG